mmetsp:Transcript_52465/g.162881  ORF Transcript_52465/g.162881 Transcript_52465/m.162881 type:complete len:410 (+) Transcript_52465:113-1342(+)|eukprot:CAMPEP_0204578916 /NCGR_PEP_ID=MMETSP0661-20131031/43197_1 /ASSEMBLY_ACC=CAM_ASM_000606 /TAXON_ID=109239 /ORGANISM="Alexandrium margalefi, Strain AMGDE01CS-322" /LENGTH=409 /DNA_ID=CAMNT_0051587883 /DNA_START=76 /DNA_END=1305 /DNA_ORIENTATION=+
MRLQSIAGFLGFCDGRRWSSVGGRRSPSREGAEYLAGAGTAAQAHCDSADSAIGGAGAAAAGSGFQLSGARRPMSAGDLQRCMQQVSSDVKPWRAGSFRLVGKLQDAVRNKGQVDEMRLVTPDGSLPVAVKRMPTSWVTKGPQEFDSTYPSAPEKPWCDIAVVSELNRLKFPFVCEARGVFRDEDTTYVVASLATKGDLFSWCEVDPLPGLAREANMRPLMAQIFTAVQWLHELGIAHRDLSLENILLTEVGQDLQVKIIDFGMCAASQTARAEVRGKQSYQAPEMHLDETYDAFLTDVFALGVTLFAMAAQDYPWTSTKRNACQLHEYVCMFGFRKFLQKRKLRKGKGEHLIDVFSPALVELLEGLLQKVPRSRTCLGESCFSYDVTGVERPTVWKSQWMASATPPPG